MFRTPHSGFSNQWCEATNQVITSGLPRGYHVERAAATVEYWRHETGYFRLEVAPPETFADWLDPREASHGVLVDTLAARIEPAPYIAALKTAFIAEGGALHEGWRFAMFDPARHVAVAADGNVEFVPVDLSNELVLPQAAEIDQELLQVAEQRLGELAARLDTPECPCIVVQGNTRREILRVAEENQVDLIVLGSHGREGIQLLLGSTANAVLHGAPCDVLAVRVTD